MILKLESLGGRTIGGVGGESSTPSSSSSEGELGSAVGRLSLEGCELCLEKFSRLLGALGDDVTEALLKVDSCSSFLASGCGFAPLFTQNLSSVSWVR